TIANALGRIGPAAVPALLDAARDGVLDSERVATALSAIGPAAVEPLVDALDANSSAVRAAAARGLGGIDSPTTEILEQLAELLSDDEPSTRAAAAKALADLGPAAKSQ